MVQPSRKRILNTTLPSSSFVGDADKLLHIKIEDASYSSLFGSFRHICHFMGKENFQMGSTLLVLTSLSLAETPPQDLGKYKI